MGENDEEAVYLATIDRFKEAVEKGRIPVGGGAAAPLSAQMKYDYLAAIHTMEQLTNLAKEFETLKNYRARLREDLLKSCSQALKKLADDKNLSLQKVDTAIKKLQEFRYEIAKIDGANRDAEKLAELIQDGVSAGH